MPRPTNNGVHIVAGIDETIQERMALYDDLPRDLRDVMKDQSFNYSPVSMGDWAKTRGVDAVKAHMLAFDRQHWREFFAEEFGRRYPL